MAIFSMLFGFAAFAQQPGNVYQRLSFDKGWLFYMGDISFPVIKGPGESERVISITIEGEQGKSAGLSGSATVK